MRSLAFAASTLVLSCSLAHGQSAFFINDALKQAMATNPGVGEAAANRRATESELRQQQSTLLPQVRVEARVGPEKFNQQIVPAPLGNDTWRNGRDVSVVGRQLVFDGFTSLTRSGVSLRASARLPLVFMNEPSFWLSTRRKPISTSFGISG